MVSNAEIKDLLRARRIYYWEIADAMHVSEMTICRWLRPGHDLPEDKQRRILDAINAIVAERAKL